MYSICGSAMYRVTAAVYVYVYCICVYDGTVLYTLYRLALTRVAAEWIKVLQCWGRQCPPLPAVVWGCNEQLVGGVCLVPTYAHRLHAHFAPCLLD